MLTDGAGALLLRVYLLSPRALAIRRRSTPCLLTNDGAAIISLAQAGSHPRRMTKTACDDCVARLAVLSKCCACLVWRLVLPCPHPCSPLSRVSLFDASAFFPNSRPSWLPSVCGLSCTPFPGSRAIYGNTCSRRSCSNVVGMWYCCSFICTTANQEERWVRA